jgi:hypothetical protein
MYVIKKQDTLMEEVMQDDGRVCWTTGSYARAVGKEAVSGLALGLIRKRDVGALDIRI